MEKYLEGGELSEEEIKAGLRRARLANEIVPMLCGSAFKNKGVQAMLDAVVEYMPAPTDVPASKACSTTRMRRLRNPSSDEAPVLGAGLQDRDRPVRRYADLLPGLLGRAELRRHGAQPGQAQEGACRPHPADALQ
jgi:hypothetical protein